MDDRRFSDEYDVTNQIGRGTFSAVYRVRHKQSGGLFAAKIIPKNQSGVSDDELTLALKLRHENVVRTVAGYADATEFVIVSELIHGGDLFSCVESAAGDRLAERDIAVRMNGLLSALEYLHSESIVHGDVKLENILWDGTRIKLIDFGHSKCIAGKSALSSQCGSPNYMAPEILLASRSSGGLLTRHATYGVEVDLWAAGVVLFVLLFGRYPFHDERRLASQKRILTASYDIPADRSVSNDVLSLLGKLLEPDPTRRLSAKEGKRHSFFACLVGGGEQAAASKGGHAGPAAAKTSTADCGAAAE
jgi:calcium/calmodulin-dependent protein kinase I